MIPTSTGIGADNEKSQESPVFLKDFTGPPNQNKRSQFALKFSMC